MSIINYQANREINVKFRFLFILSQVWDIFRELGVRLERLAEIGSKIYKSYFLSVHHGMSTVFFIQKKVLLVRLL